MLPSNGEDVFCLTVFPKTVGRSLHAHKIIGENRSYGAGKGSLEDSVLLLLWRTLSFQHLSLRSSGSTFSAPSCEEVTEDSKSPLGVLLAGQISPWPLPRCPVLQSQPSWWPPLDPVPGCGLASASRGGRSHPPPPSCVPSHTAHAVVGVTTARAPHLLLHTCFPGS